MLTHAVLSAWLLARMVSAIPPGTHQAANALETSAEQESRYEAIAGAIAKVALDPKEPPVFRGRLGTAALLLSISYFESAWRKDVDTGVGTRARGDSGGSCTCWQLNRGFAACVPLLASRELAAREALHVVRISANACRYLGSSDAMLNVYASGSCMKGQYESAVRIEKARKWLRENPLPKDPS